VPSSSRRTVPLPADWGSVRPAVLARDPVCRYGIAELGETGSCMQPSAEVDHIGSPWDHRLEMLRGICAVHHLKRSSMQGNAARARLRSLRLRPPERHPGYMPSVPDAAEDPL
jgi:hypothetical protein